MPKRRTRRKDIETVIRQCNKNVRSFIIFYSEFQRDNVLMRKFTFGSGTAVKMPGKVPSDGTAGSGNWIKVFINQSAWFVFIQLHYVWFRRVVYLSGFSSLPTTSLNI